MGNEKFHANCIHTNSGVIFVVNNRLVIISPVKLECTSAC